MKTLVGAMASRKWCELADFLVAGNGFEQRADKKAEVIICLWRARSNTFSNK